MRYAWTSHSAIDINAHTHTHIRACVPFVEHTHSVYATSLHLSPLKKNFLALVDTKSYVEVLWFLSPKWSITTHMCHVQSMKCKQSGDAIISLLIRHWRMQNFSGGGQPFYWFFHAHAMGVRHAPRAFFFK